MWQAPGKNAKQYIYWAKVLTDHPQKNGDNLFVAEYFGTVNDDTV